MTQRPSQADAPLSAPASGESAGGAHSRLTARSPFAAALFVALFGILLASFPARSADLWKHLADGRDLLHFRGGPTPTWLYDLVSYATFSLSPTALAALKALLCGAVGVVMLLLAHPTRRVGIPVAITCLALLAMGNRFMLQPATVSVLFLALTVWQLAREKTGPQEVSGFWPGWRLVVLFVLWANTDGRFTVGLGVVALAWLGRLLDSPPAGGFWRAFGPRAGSWGVLVAASCLSPAHVSGLRAPPELAEAVRAMRQGPAEDRPLNSPFDRDYLTMFRESPAALAWYPLLGLGLVSFVLNRGAWRWSRFLPWFALALASAVQIRLAPMFVVVAGPVTTWNLQEFFADREGTAAGRGRLRYALSGAAVALAGAFLVALWPGWLQGPPFEPRRWVVETPTALQQGAGFLRRAREGNLWPADSRTLHASADAESTFAWFDPDDRAVRDDKLVRQLLDPEAVAARERLRELGVTRVVVYAGDTAEATSAASQVLIDRLLLVPHEWPVLHLTGGLLVFGWRDPEAPPDATRLAGWEVDFTRLALRPEESERAPTGGPPEPRRWWEAFWRQAPRPRPPDRDEASVLLRKARAMAAAAPSRHGRSWEAAQAAGLAASAAGWFDARGPFDAAVRAALVRPLFPDNAKPDTRPPAIAQTTFGFYQQFASDGGAVPAGLLYASIRAGRRAVAENPGDANAHLVLGRAYVGLLTSTAEQAWAGRLPQLMQLRRVQAVAALNRAVTLNPDLAAAHLELGRLYLSLDTLDLAVHHLNAYANLPPRWGGPQRGDESAKDLLRDLARLNQELQNRLRVQEQEASQASVADRAFAAARRGLYGHARDLLLKTDVAAFGAQGADLELGLLLRTGRPEDVLEATAGKGVRELVGEFSFHWLRVQALLAVGDYADADAEMGELTGSRGGLPTGGELGVPVGKLVGKLVLDEIGCRPGSPLTMMRALYEADFRGQVARITEQLGLVADTLVLRGIVALEVGNVGQARELFQAALALSPGRWGDGQLDFNGRAVAWGYLALIEAGAGPPKP